MAKVTFVRNAIVCASCGVVSRGGGRTATSGDPAINRDGWNDRFNSFSDRASVDTMVARARFDMLSDSRNHLEGF